MFLLSLCISVNCDVVWCDVHSHVMCCVYMSSGSLNCDVDWGDAGGPYDVILLFCYSTGTSSSYVV